MKKFSFIVLHYKLIDVTIRCVDSILESCNGNIEIVIVDNASQDGSGEYLRNYYSKNINVEIIILNKSTGFSYGNNRGYKYLCENGESDFIIECNNDLIFKQKNFLKIIERLYEVEKFDVLGPDIRNIDGVHQSPLMLKGRSADEILSYINYCTSILKNAKYIALKKRISKRFNKLYSLYKKIFKSTDRIDYSCDYNDVVLCGACMIFSKKYIDSHELLFNPEVSFYHEEEILLYELKKCNGKIIYRPQLYVVHDHSRATNVVNNTELEHTIFEMKNAISSAKTLYSIVKDYEKNYGK